jgi:AraC-like DNA-binding protein
MSEVIWESLCPYIREAGFQRMDAWHIPRRIYDHQFLYCLTGVAHAVIQEAAHRITPGILMIIPPNVPHTLWMDERHPAELIWFHCDFYLFDDRQWIYETYNTVERYVTLFGAELPHKEHIRENPVFPGGIILPGVLNRTGAEELEYSFRAIHRAYTGDDAWWQLTARRYFFAILETVLTGIAAEPGRGALRIHAVNQMKAYIAKHYFEPLNVEKVCRDTGLNTEYASKLFRKVTGQRLVEYISRYRINQAQKLLIDPDLSAADIAEMAGFGSENYFCTVLKKLEGRTPVQLRAYLRSLLLEEDAAGNMK